MNSAPKLTENEWRLIAWLVASLAWIKSEWDPHLVSLSKKLREALGDAAVSERARPAPETPAS